MTKRPDIASSVASSVGGVFGGLLLLLSLATLLLGVAGALYLGRDTEPAALAPSPAATHAPRDASEPIPPELARALDAIQPAAGPAEGTAPSNGDGQAAGPAPEAAGQAPSSRCAAVPLPSNCRHTAVEKGRLAGSGQGESPVFRVEYGAYGAGHPASAKRLANALAALGISVTVEPARAADGRLLYRVRSTAPDLAAAEREAQEASRALPVDPLIHRTASRAGPETAGYRVQFAALDQLRQAEQLRRRLARHGIAGAVTRGHHPSGRPVFFVTTAGSADRLGAAAAARQAHSLLGLEPLITRSVQTLRHGKPHFKTTARAPANPARSGG